MCYIKYTMKKAIDKTLDRSTTKRDLVGFAKKKDLEKFATKQDLNKFAKKSDLKVFATKKYLKRFATKKEFKLEIGKLKSELQQDIADVRSELKIDFYELKEEFTLFRKTQNEIYKMLDGALREMKTYREEQTMASFRINNLEAHAITLGEKLSIPYNT